LNLHLTFLRIFCIVYNALAKEPTNQNAMRATLESIKETGWMTWEATFSIEPSDDRGSFESVETKSFEISVELDFENAVSKSTVKTVAEERVKNMFDFDYFSA